MVMVRATLVMVMVMVFYCDALPSIIGYTLSPRFLDLLLLLDGGGHDHDDDGVIEVECLMMCVLVPTAMQPSPSTTRRL